MKSNITFKALLYIAIQLLVAKNSYADTCASTFVTENKLSVRVENASHILNLSETIENIRNQNDVSLIEKAKSLLEYSPLPISQLIQTFSEIFSLDYIFNGPISLGQISLTQHSIGVLKKFNAQIKYWPADSLSKRLGINTYKILAVTLLFHDLGKPFAVWEKDLSLEHLFTTMLVTELLSKMKFSSKEMLIAINLIDNKRLIERIIRGDESFEILVSELKKLAYQSKLNTIDFFQLLSFYFMCDASYYSRLSHLFSSDRGKLKIINQKYIQFYRALELLSMLNL